MSATEGEVLRQLRRSGYFPAGFNRYTLSADGTTLVGNVQVALVDLLKLDTHFAHGNFYGLHRDVGAALIDFRSYNGALGKGSLQLVISRATGDCYADVDDHNPYQDVVRFVGHTGELVHHLVRRLFRKGHA